MKDEEIVSVAGIVQAVKMKSTRNNSMMAYVTVEDDTASMEMLAFSNVLNQYGGYLKENEPVVIAGRFSVRDDKDPQIVINRARPMSDFVQEKPQPAEEKPAEDKPVIYEGTLKMKLDGMSDPRYKKVNAITNMFPGNSVVKVYLSDIGKWAAKRACLDSRMIKELKALLGDENVVII